MTKNIIFIFAAFCTLQPGGCTTHRRILYAACSVTMTLNCFSRYSPHILTEWSSRHGNRQLVRQYRRRPTAFLGTPLAAKTCSGG